MVFRADEARQSGFERAWNYLIGRNIEESEREKSDDALSGLIQELGPVIESYPHWHPLVSNLNLSNLDWMTHQLVPRNRSGFDGLDHTVFFADGFVTCPYDDGQKVIDSVEKLYNHPDVEIVSERLQNVQLYHPRANPIKISCQWRRSLAIDETIPKSIAVPLLLERELKNWRNSEFADTWETMRPFILGCPHGSRSSLFINQETGQVLKDIWKALVSTGMFGNIRADVTAYDWQNRFG